MAAATAVAPTSSSESILSFAFSHLHCFSVVVAAVAAAAADDDDRMKKENEKE